MTRRHRSGRVDIRPDERRLLIDGEAVPIGARAFDLLVTLIDHRHRVVGQDELLDLVWPGLVVEPNNLQVQVSTLRKLLGAQAVATIPGRGYRLTLPLDEDDSPAAGSAAPPAFAAHHLPHLATKPLGRDEDLDALVALLPEHRLVTITGAGGIGKSTLALVAAHRQQHVHTHGIAWVESAALADASLLPGAVARAAGVPISTAPDPLPSLIESLKPLSLLLVLDNAEGLLQMAARLVAAVLAAAPQVRVLVTSQAPLKIDIEQVYRLAALSVPAQGASVDQARGHGAVALFVARAQAADRGFALTPENVDAVATLCRRLGGIPLALQLAAARLPHLGLQGITERLTEMLLLPSGGGRDAPSRQQTLRAALDWSYSLLDVTGQSVLRRLGVFPSGFTLEGARAVAGDAGLDEGAVIDALGALVDRSLVAMDGAREPRYRLTESTRAYARIKLDEAGERDTSSQRLAQALAAALDIAYREYWSTADQPWLSRWAPEINNVRAALTWSTRHEPTLALALAGGASPLFLLLGLAPELRKCNSALVPWAETQPSSAAVSRFWLESARLNWGTSNLVTHAHADKAAELYRSALVEETAREPRTIEPGARQGLYMALRFLVGSSALPAAEVQRALGEMARLEQPHWPAGLRAQRSLAEIAALKSAGHLQRACQSAENLLAQATAAGLGLATSAARSELASLNLALGNAPAAIGHARILLESDTQHSDNFVVHAHAALVQASLAMGHVDDARSAMVDFLAASRVRDFESFDLYADLYALIAASEGRVQSAARLLGHADVAARRVGERSPNAHAVRAKVGAMIESALSATEVTRLIQEGAEADPALVCRWTLAQGPQHGGFGRDRARRASGLPEPPSPSSAEAIAGEPERRQLTVMFCDLVGSAALSHRLDPEDLVEVIHRYQHRAREVIARYEGHIAQYLGDGMLAYFGYPKAHEDDAARAIHAALEIVQVLAQSDVHAGQDERMDVRIGIATGLVVVGDLSAGGAPSHVEAMGATPNIAARIQALAEPGSVLVAQRTRELAAGAFEYIDAGQQQMEGIPQPAQVWRVVGKSNAESRFDAAHGRPRTPLVGRATELNALLMHWKQTCSGAGRVVLLSGEAGIGKSRLAETLEEAIAHERHIRLLYQCSPYHAHSALSPVIQQIERSAGFTQQDTATQRLDKLYALLARATPDIGEIGALYSALLSLPAGERFAPLEMSPQQRKDRTFAALIDLLSGLAAQAPVLFVFEDIHWIDPTSAEWLGLLAQQVSSMPVLCLFTSRSDGIPAWLDKGKVHTLALERLDTATARMLVARLLEATPTSAQVVDEVVARSDGVPLFMEELAKSLSAPERTRQRVGAAPSTVPATLQDSLMARLDQLGDAKEVAQIASVIGREFSRELVAAASDLEHERLGSAIELLTASTVVVGRDAPPSTTFYFRHALLQDAAYASLVRGRRQELHRRIAVRLDATASERARAEPELLAHHFTEAAMPAPAARHRAAAAQRALDRSANREALSHTEKGLELIPAIPASAERDRLEMGLEILRGAAHRAVTGFASSECERSFSRALELATLLDDTTQAVDARRGLFACYYARGALLQARGQSQQLAELAERAGDAGSRMLAHWMLGCITFWQGEFAVARRELESAVSLYEPLARHGHALALQIDPAVNALLHLSWTLWIVGHPEQGLRTADRAVGTARALSQPYSLAMALFWAALTQASCGRHASAQNALDELMTLTAEHGFSFLGSCARVLQAQELTAQDRCAEALQLIDRAFAEFRTQEAGVGMPWAISISAAAYARMGRTEAGLAALAAALQAVERNGERHWEAELWRLKGELLLQARAGVGDEAEVCLRTAIELAQWQGARSLELRAVTSLARLLLGRGEATSARHMLAQTLNGFSEGGDTADHLDAKALLDASL